MTTSNRNSLTPAAAAAAGKVSYESFLQSDWGSQHVEWVNGEVVFMAPISDEHQDVGLFLLALLRHFVEARDAGVVMYEPFQMKTGPDLPGRSPDGLFVAKENLPRLKKTFLDGPADIAVEIVSPGSGTIDRGEKFYEYEQGGVREYWLIDPLRKQAEFYQRGADGFYRLAILQDGIFRSSVLEGLWLKVDWLWERPLPSLLSVLKQWKLV